MSSRVNSTCEHCGQRKIEHGHRLNQGLVTGLRRLVAAGGKNVHLQDLDLDYSQRCNFQKLQYWGFVRRGEKRGQWTATLSGLVFLGGSSTAPVKVWTYQGKFVEADEDAGRVTAAEADPHYQLFEDYVAEERPHDDKKEDEGQ